MTDSTSRADIEALRDLLQSRGWSIFTKHVMAEVADDFENTITKALSHPETPLALDKARQVAAVRLAGLRWLRLPKERLDALEQEQKRQDEIVHSVGRRPVGV